MEQNKPGTVAKVLCLRMTKDEIHASGRTIWKLYWYFKRSSVWCVRWMDGTGTWRFQNPSVCYAVGIFARRAVFC